MFILCWLSTSCSREPLPAKEAGIFKNTISFKGYVTRHHSNSGVPSPVHSSVPRMLEEELFLFSRTMNPKAEIAQGLGIGSSCRDGRWHSGGVVPGLLGPGEIHLLVDTILLTASNKGPITAKQFKKEMLFMKGTVYISHRNRVWTAEVLAIRSKRTSRIKTSALHNVTSLQLSAHGQS